MLVAESKYENFRKSANGSLCAYLLSCDAGLLSNMFSSIFLPNLMTST